MKKLEIGNSIYTDHYQRAKLGSNVEYINHPSMTQVPTRNQQPQNQVCPTKPRKCVRLSACLIQPSVFQPYHFGTASG